MTFDTLDEDEDSDDESDASINSDENEELFRLNDEYLGRLLQINVLTHLGWPFFIDNTELARLALSAKV